MTKDFRLAGWFMLVFLVTATIMGALGLWQSGGKAAAVEPRLFLKGDWALAYEKAFNEKVAIHDPSIQTWGLINYTLFKDGREGVLIGRNGWLFTKEEFDYYPDADKQLQEKIDYITGVRDMLAEKNIKLVVVPIPAKARVYKDELGRYRYPSYKQNIYNEFVEILQSRSVAVADPLPAMDGQKNNAPLYLKTDTHWSPAGAKLAADIIAQTVQAELSDLVYPKTFFGTEIIGYALHKGDLLRYVPLGKFSAALGFKPDSLENYAVAEANPEAQAAEADLFAYEILPVTLVGTSYSANKLWNFEGFLKESLQANVLNAADEGMGPFETMKKYLADEAFATNPPQLIVWEIPERYLPVPYKLDTGPDATVGPLAKLDL